MRKDQIKKQSSIRTIDEEYNEYYSQFREQTNTLPIEFRNLIAINDLNCGIREACIYLNQYKELIPPKLERVMKERIRECKKRVVERFRKEIEDKGITLINEKGE